MNDNTATLEIPAHPLRVKEENDPARARDEFRTLSVNRPEQKACTAQTGFSENKKYLTDKPLHRPAGFFLATLYRASAKQPRAACDYVFDVVEHFLGAKEFGEVDALLRQADVMRLDPSVLTALLALTAPAKERLAERSGFVQRAAEALNKAVGPVEAEAILKFYR